jgi:hypothetical protein
MQSLSLMLTAMLAGAGATARAAPPERVAPSLADPPSFTLGLLPYVGLGMLVAHDGTESYVVGGGSARVTFGQVMIGGFGEASVLPDYYLGYLGGFAGAYLPFRSWVDLDVAVGFGARTYLNRARESYLGDYRVTLPAGTLRLGVSDRAGEVLGVRLGGGLVTSVDLDPQQRTWRIAPSDIDPEGSSGTRHFGSFTLALVLTVGLDIQPDYEPAPAPPPTPGPRPSPGSLVGPWPD